MNDDGKIKFELVLWIGGITIGVIVLYTIGAFITLGILEARDNDPPKAEPDYNTSYDERRSVEDRLARRKARRENTAWGWLFALLYYLIFRWAVMALLWCGLRIEAAFNGLRRFGQWLGRRRAKPEPEPHLEPEATKKDELPKARVVRR